MLKLKKLLFVGVLLSSVAAVGLQARAEKVYEGAVCSTRVHELTSGIDWYTDLKKAEKAAQEQNKLVFWMHMLGKIDGAT